MSVEELVCLVSIFIGACVLSVCVRTRVYVCVYRCCTFVWVCVCTHLCVYMCDCVSVLLCVCICSAQIITV